jgi:hypothetical protein
MPKDGIVCVGGGGIERGTLVPFETCIAHSLGMPCRFTPEMLRAMRPQPDRDPDVVSVTDLLTDCVRSFVLKRREPYHVSPEGEYMAWRGTIAHLAAESQLEGGDPVFAERRVYKRTATGRILSGKPDWATPLGGGLLKDYKTVKSIERMVSASRGEVPKPQHLKQLEGYQWLLDGGCLLGTEDDLIRADIEFAGRGIRQFFGPIARCERVGLVYDEPVPDRMAAALQALGQPVYAMPVRMVFDRVGVVYLDMSEHRWYERAGVRDLDAVGDWIAERAEVRYRALERTAQLPPEVYGSMGWECGYCEVSELCRVASGVPATRRLASSGSGTVGSFAAAVAVQAGQRGRREVALLGEPGDPLLVTAGQRKELADDAF